MRVLLSLLLVLGPVTATSGQAERDGRSDAPTRDERLAAYYEALRARRLLTVEAVRDADLVEAVRRGEQEVLGGRYDEAQRTLYEVVESPRYAMLESLDEYRSAEYMLAEAMHRLGALRSAKRYLYRILRRGPDDPYYGPAFRRAVDVALDSFDLAAAVAELEAFAADDPLPPDAAYELYYLTGRAHLDANEAAAAADALSQVPRQSRFYANAQYLLGVVAARKGALDEAEARFCSIATTADADHYTFFVDQRYFNLRDLTWLALGRVAHEGRRPEDAFYYYFQVPQDSEKVASALFEAAWAMYEGGEHDSALDLLDQLEARFSETPRAHEASLLRGYIHLARCEFDEALNLFTRFTSRFSPVLAEIDRILADPSRKTVFLDELRLASHRTSARSLSAADGVTREVRASGEARAPREEASARLFSLLTLDPEFHRRWRAVRTLDAERARAGRVPTELDAILGRVRGGDAPRPAQPFEDAPDTLLTDVIAAQAALATLTAQLDPIRHAQPRSPALTAAADELLSLGRRAARLRRRLQLHAPVAGVAEPPSGEDLAALLTRDRNAARGFPARTAAVRAGLVQRANAAALVALRSLRHELGGYLRRARIGRIDAVMGSKRRLEIQIESLAAGRFPPELQNPLAVQGLLRDDEEYWPFQGEYWRDEFEEDEPDEAAADEDTADEDAANEDTADEPSTEEAQRDGPAGAAPSALEDA